ncbi:rod shape-determining protein MreC [Polaromonas sp. YR568]|uniref:rod shape-determining protein MreC n=1 Tax=Polaromonas sp. YR568 TaxID=1855301 RepID=UPI003137FDF7
MPLGTLDRTPPPFFKQGPSALSKLMFFSALALFLMVADLRFKITQPIRAAVATVLYPVQWLALQPVRAAQYGGGYFTALSQARTSEEEARQKLATQSLRASQVEQLALENSRLRKLLDLREQAALTGQAAQVLYDAPDLYTRKVIIDKGMLQGVALGSPVVDESGVLGQVTRVHPLVSEVTLVIDRDLAIPVLNTRTGARSVAFGEPTTHGGGLELRFMGSNSDVQQGDLLTTSGVDGLYPPGLPVAKIDRIERRAESAFARIYCTPLAQVNAAVHVMVVKPLSGEKLPAAAADPAPVAVKKGAGK